MFVELYDEVLSVMLEWRLVDQDYLVDQRMNPENCPTVLTGDWIEDNPLAKIKVVIGFFVVKKELKYITSRFGRPGFLCGEIVFAILVRLPKLCECCRCFFFDFVSHPVESADWFVCNDNWLLNDERELLNDLLCPSRWLLPADARWVDLCRELYTNGASTTTFCGRTSSLSNV